MSNFQNAFLVTITQENDTYNYKNTKDFSLVTFNKFIFYKAFFFCSRFHQKINHLNNKNITLLFVL